MGDLRNHVRPWLGGTWCQWGAPMGSVGLITTGYPLLPTAQVKLSPTRATKAAVLSTPRRRALKQNKRSRGNEPNLFATGPRPPQECGRMVTTGGSHGDAEPQHPHSRPRHPGVSTMLPLLLLLLPAAHGIGESSHASEMGSGFPLALRGSSVHRHQDLAEPGGVGQLIPILFWILFWVSPLVSGVTDVG